MTATLRPRAETAFASAPRESIGTVLEQRAAFMAEPVGVSLLEAMPGPAFVLNSRRQIVSMNRLLVETLGIATAEDALGLRPGEAVHCTHAAERAGGCGTTSSCAQCGAVQAVLECLATRRRAVRECRITTTSLTDGGALDFRVHASPLTCGAHDFVTVGLEDIRDEKRREILERVFFHELLDTARGVHDLAGDLLARVGESGETLERCGAMERLSGLVVEQIEAQRALLAAELGELEVRVREVDLAELLDRVVEVLRGQEPAAGRNLRCEAVRRCPIETDPLLVERTVGSLLRNALEATPPGGTVELMCEYEREVATISVHNHGVIPDDVQNQIFQRSFTTTGRGGRGIGTYGARLFVERYLKGRIAFMSEPRVGTLFLVMLPRRMPGSRPA